MRNLSPVNYSRAKILKRSFAELRDTFRNRPLALPGPEVQTVGYPISVATIRRCLEESGIRSGDIVHIQSSTSFLMNGSPRPPEESYSSSLEYAVKVVEMLKDLVGPRGTLSMCTDSIKKAYHFYLKEQVFDFRRSPSHRGLISEVFRRTAGAIRSVHPWYNVTAYGKEAEALVRDHHLSTPYAMDEHSPWFKLNAFGGKVALLGKTFDSNSIIHCPEFVYPREFPRPVFMDKPVSLRYIDRDLATKVMPVMLHAPVWVDGSPTPFSMYLQEREKEPIYRIHEFQSGVKIVAYQAQTQFDAICRAMRENVTWYDARFHPK
jgi:aminoglycoside 3-N-acetyltransferase